MNCSRCGLEIKPGELIAELPDNSKAWHEPLVCVARQAERIKVLEEENAALRADKEWLEKEVLSLRQQTYLRDVELGWNAARKGGL